MFPAMAVITASMAIIRPTQLDLSGRGNLSRFIFNIMFPNPNNTITDKKAMVYTPANFAKFPLVANNMDTQSIKKSV